MDENVVVFDVETQHDFASVGGVQFTERLGVSVAVAYAVAQRRFLHFTEKEMDALVALLQGATLVVGFNIRRFDLRVLAPYTEVNLSDLPICDLMEDVERNLGHRVKLDTLAHQTLGIKKSADGSLALKWWREGQMDLIHDYCQQDVEMTRRLWEYGRAHGHIWYWDHTRKQRRPTPVRW